MSNQLLENYKTVIDNQRTKIEQLEKITKRQEQWSNERANTYLELGEMEAVLYSKETPTVKVKRCKEIIKNLNDPEYMSQFVG